MVMFVEKELSDPRGSIQRSAWEDHAKKLGLDPQDFVNTLENGTEYHKGLRALLGERTDVAISFFKGIAQSEQAEKTRTQLFLGHAYAVKAQYRDALAAYEKATVLDTESPPAWSGKGQCLVELGRHEEALGALDRAIELDPKVPEFWKYKGESLQKLGRHRDALQALEQVIGLNRPGDAATWKMKGVSLAGIGHFREARDAFNTAIEMDPGDAAAWKYKGAALVNLGRNKDAREAFDRSLELNPDDGETWKFKGVALENLDRLDEAVEAYSKAMALNPEDADAWKYKGMVFLGTKRYEDALAAFDRIPEGYDRWKYRGIALAELQRYEESQAELEKADGERPEQAEIWYWKGQVLQRTNRLQGGDPGLSSRNPDKAGLFRGLGKHRGNHDKPRAQSGCRQRLGKGKKNNRIPQVKNGHSPEVFRTERDLAPCINSGINLLKERISITLLREALIRQATKHHNGVIPAKAGIHL